jgi:hypothetical protein
MFSLMLLLSASAIASAQSDGRPLPPFTVYDAQGSPIQSDAIAPSGRSTLVFVRPSCGACEQLLGTLSRLAAPNAGTQLVIVVLAPVEQAAAFAARALPAELQAARWLADVDASAWTALNLKGAPVLVGVENARIAWSYNGAPARSLLNSLMRTWLMPTGGVR